MAVVTKTIGTSSRDYSTITLWEAAIDNTTYPSAGTDVVGECYDDSAFDEVVTLDAAPTNMNSMKLSVASTERHDGTAGNGARIVRTGTGTVISCIPIAGTQKQIIEWLEFNLNATATLITISASGATAGRVPVVQRCILHDATNSAANFYAIRASGRDICLQDNIIYDFVSGSNNRAATGYGASCNQANGACLNNTVYKITAHGTGAAKCYEIAVDSANGKIRNNIGVGCTTNPACFTFAGAVNLTSSNNLSDDATADDGGGSNHVINATLANIFVSTTNGSEDLSLKAGSPAIDLGVDLVTTPTGVNIDIKGRDRDAQGDTWDIGAHEYVATVTNRDGLLLMGVGA